MTRHRSLVLGALLAGSMVALAILAPWVAVYDPERMDMANRLAGPSGVHWLGTDNFGRDLWARMAFGARISVAIGCLSVGAAALLGTAIGLLAGYHRGWIDSALMGIVDLFLGFPPIVLALALVAALGPGALNVGIAVAAVLWTQFARVVRAITLVESEREYIVAARAMGVPRRRILLRQLLPGTIGPVLVLATLGVGTAVVAESGLSFLGFGVQPPTPTWGWTLAYGTRYLRAQAWLSTVPGMFILITVLGFNLFGDGLRDVLDPRRVTVRRSGVVEQGIR